MFFDFVNQERCGFINTTLQQDCVCTRRDVPQAFFDDRMSQHGCGRRPIACCIVSLGCGLTNQRNACVLDVVFEFDFFGDRYTIINDLRRSILLFQNDVTALRTEGYSNRFRQNVHTAFKGATCVLVVYNALSHGSYFSVSGLNKGLRPSEIVAIGGF